jgi:hypothetical protein
MTGHERAEWHGTNMANFRHQLIERGRHHLAARMHQNEIVTDVRAARRR